jgi:4-amino-4-deoxy-L-arabinose transferase-like glycosyltransferase
LGIAAVVLRIPAFFSQQPVHPDDGFYGAAVVAMRDGGVPYRDVFSSQGPLHLPLLYLGDLLGWRTFDAPRVTPVVAGVAATLLTYLIGRRLTSRGGALLAAAVVATSGSVLFVTSGITSDGPTLAFALGAFLAALRYREQPSVGRIVAVALLVAGAVLVKPALGALAVLASVYLVVRVRRTRDLAIGAATAIAAAFVVAAPFGLGRVWDQTVSYQLGSHREQSMLLNARKIVTTLWDRDPILFALALLTIAAAIWLPRRRADEDRDPERALWLWAGVLLVFLVVEPALWRNHLSSIIAPLALVVALRPPPLRWIVIAAIVVVPLQASHLRGFFWPASYSGTTGAAHQALEALPRGSWALSDDVGLLWRSHTRPTDDLVDTSIKRQEQGDVDAQHVAEEAANPRVCAVLVWWHKYWGSFDDLPALLARENYQPVQHFAGQAGDRVLYTRPCPTLVSLD